MRKVTTGRLQSVIGHVATPLQGVGSAWGKDLAPPERPGVRAVRAVPGAGTDTQRPLSRLPPPSPPLSNSFKQPLTSFLTHRRSNLPFFSPLLLPRGSILGRPLKNNATLKGYKRNVFPKFQEEITRGGLPGASGSRARALLRLVLSAALLTQCLSPVRL